MVWNVKIFCTGEIVFPLFVVVAAGVVAWVYLRTRPKQRVMVPVTCPNPSCIRCQRYRQVQCSARSRMPWVARQVRQTHPDDSLDRICDSIQNPQKFCSSFQAPTVLMVRDLPSEEVVTKIHEPEIKRHLSDLSRNSNLVDEILSEVDRVDHTFWNRNDTPTGSWEVLPLLNQGQWDIDIARQCPRLMQVVKQVPNLLDGSLFGNAMVSKIFEGTFIEPHCGPTNVRHRLQYTLLVPIISNYMQGSRNTSPFLEIGRNVRLSWRRPGEFFVFDDSFVHSVDYPSSKTKCKDHRMVLIIDLWHPDLSPGERNLIRDMYPPFDPRRGGGGGGGISIVLHSKTIPESTEGGQ